MTAANSMPKTASKLILTNKTVKEIVVKMANKTPKTARKAKIKTLTSKPLTPKIKQLKLSLKNSESRRKIYPPS